jgi:hypothetical protein
MDNSILPILPGIHATILSIISAVLIVFFFYSYQTVSSLKEQLDDLRITVAKMMSPFPYYKPGAESFRIQDYLHNGKLNLKTVEEKLAIISNVMSNLELMKGVPPHPDMGENYIEETIIEEGKHLLEIINLLINYSPYCEKISIEGDSVGILGGAKIIKYDTEWQNDLIRLNSSLSWTWRVRGKGITELISKYDAISAKKDTKQTFHVNHPQFISEFFTQVQFIETRIIPELSEKSYKLHLHEHKFKIKTRLIPAFFIAIFILVFGIFLPLFIHLYSKPTYIKQIELTLVIITFLPYLYYLLWGLKKILELEFR